MKAEYLIGVSQKSSSFPQVSILGNGRDTWYASTYKVAKAKTSIKNDIRILTNKITGRDTSLRDWEWHHVVETQHISQIINSDLSQEEWHNMPTILISRIEHRFLSQNFNNNAFRELATISKGRKKTATKSKALSKEERKKRITKINNLRRMYQNSYLEYPTLYKIAENVFDYHLRKL